MYGVTTRLQRVQKVLLSDLVRLSQNNLVRRQVELGLKPCGIDLDALICGEVMKIVLIESAINSRI